MAFLPFVYYGDDSGLKVMDGNGNDSLNGGAANDAVWKIAA